MTSDLDFTLKCRARIEKEIVDIGEAFTNRDPGETAEREELESKKMKTTNQCENLAVVDRVQFVEISAQRASYLVNFLNWSFETIESHCQVSSQFSSCKQGGMPMRLTCDVFEPIEKLVSGQKRRSMT